MLDKIKKVFETAMEELAQARQDMIADLRVKYLGKNGELTALLRGMKDVSAEERPKIGKLVNEARDAITARIEAKELEAKTKERAKALSAETLDVTLEGAKPNVGSLHPCTLVRNEIVDIFSRLGFKVAEGPEVETDYFCFQALNIPKDHPARDMQDTFYVSDDVVLRTHTSPMQIRTLLAEKPPIKIVIPGKVYRPDDDASHSPMFQQVEGLVVDKGINLCHLKGVLEEFARQLFDSETKTRLRPSYFPFTEPSVEVDVTCSICHGKGCRVCKGTGWIEILGAGIINPKVLQNCGVDDAEYSGFAFGMGIERTAMIKYGIPDMRLMFENDIRFLKQFN